MKNWLKALFLLTVTGLLVFALAYDINSNSKIEVATVLPKYRTIEEKVIVSGVIQPLRLVKVNSNISGVVEQLFVKPGDVVKNGQFLAKVKFVSDPIERERLLRSLNTVTIKYENDRKQYERNKKLFENKVISKVEYEQFEAAYYISKAEVKSIRAELKLYEGEMDTGQISNIIASTAVGTVLELPVEAGGNVLGKNSFNEGTIIAKIADTGILRFVGSVSEDDVNELHIGMPVLLEIGTTSEHQVEARLEYIAPLGQFADGVTRFEIHAMLPTANLNGHLIRAGSSATAQIVTAKKTKALSVEEKDLIFDGDSVFVELLVGDHVKKRAIKLGLSDGLIVEVTKGLSMKDRIKVKIENSQQ
jgi:HlyD family secretion protein